MAGWLGWLDGWMAGWMAGWLDGWLGGVFTNTEGLVGRIG